MADELYGSDDGRPTSGLHVAFPAGDRDGVERVHGPPTRSAPSVVVTPT